MGKISLDFHFLNGDGDVISTVTFNSLDDIDLRIEKLQEARAEFEHRIEMKRQKAREKRKRRNKKLRNESGTAIGELENSYKEFMDYYNQIPEPLKTLLKPAADAITDLVESARRENGK